MNHNAVEILIVEDSMADAELAIRSLRKSNMANNLIHLKDGAEALDFLFCRGEFADRNPAQKPKLILLDIKMPKVDGLEVLRQIKGNAATRFIPVVVMTSSSEETDLFTSYNLGVNSYVVKPVDFEKFAAAIAELGMYWLLINKAMEFTNNDKTAL